MQHDPKSCCIHHKPKLLDLFCGAGGASVGLARAGFEVTGVDIKPQPNYPFHFILGDALTVPLYCYDAYWASPPCWRYQHLLRWRHPEAPNLIAVTRTRLVSIGKPYIIENVVGAPLINPLALINPLLKFQPEQLWPPSLFAYLPVSLRYNIDMTTAVYGLGGVVI